MATSCAPTTQRLTTRRATWLAVAVAFVLAYETIERLSPEPVFPYVESEEEFLEELEEDFGVDGSALANLVRENDPLAIEAAFPHESYAPRTTARLRLWTTLERVRIRIYRAGPERMTTVGYKEMRGVPMGAARSTRLGPTRTVDVELGNWPSGLYFARLTARGGRAGFAPFVLRPRRLGQNRVAVVLPTHTWQAYNFRDDDGDGRLAAACGLLARRRGAPLVPG